MKAAVFAGSLVVVLIAAAAARAQAVVADLPTPLGTERAAFLAAPGARATVVLLAGGEGIVRISQAGDTGSNNFLIRTRAMWAQYGINAVILGSPNDASLMGQRAGGGYVAALGPRSISPAPGATRRSGWSAPAWVRSRRRTVRRISGRRSPGWC
ncbi:MAG TPA: hypothetical protein VHW66_14665 [Stellaceae bacterium]|jgi:hypothetical protein|nr:hypothetical protein [Stellaceae bacterium]